MVIKEILQGVIEGNGKVVQESIKKALDEGIDPAAILNEGLIPAMTEVGRLFETSEYYVPEMLISARAMQNGMTLLKPHLIDSNIQSEGIVVIGTVKGDLHDIGKNLVAMMLEGAGFEVVDLGTDASPRAFVRAIKDEGANVLAMSALLTTTMPNMEATLQVLGEAGIRDQVMVIVGGAPVTDDYAANIGADGFAPDAYSAVKTAKFLVSQL